MIWLGALALVFTLLILHWSSLHGRLAQDITADDSAYFADGLRRVETLYRGGLAALAQGALQSPPHSPYATLMAFLGFLFLGVHDWVPYLTNALLVFVLLLFVDHAGRELGRATRNILLFVTLTVPFAFVAVHDFRPDFAVALCTAMGVFVGLEAAMSAAGGPAWQRRIFQSGLFFGVAFLIKPPFFPHTAVLSAVPAVFLGLAWLGWTGRPRQGFAELMRIEARYFAGVLLVPLPFFLWDHRHILEYFLINTGRGAEAPLWRMSGGPLAVLGQYTTAGSMGEMLGNYFYAFGFLCLGGLALYGRARNRPQALLMAGVLVAVALSLAIMVYGRYLNPFFGLSYQILLLAGAVRSLGPHPRLGSWGNRAWIGSLLVFSGWNLLSPSGSNYASARLAESSPTARRAVRQLVEVIAANVPAGFPRNMQQRGPVVAFTYWGDVNSATFDWVALRQGHDFSIRDFHRYGDPKRIEEQIADADVVVLSRPHTPGINAALPSTPLQLELINTLEHDGTRRRLAEIGIGQGGLLVLMRENLRTIDRGGRGEGLLPVEGPYPQWKLGLVRWGTFPETDLRVEASVEQQAELVMEARGSQDQILTLLVNGQMIAEHFFKPGEFESIRASFTLRPGTNQITFRYAAAEKTNDDARPRAVLFRRIDLLRSVAK